MISFYDIRRFSEDVFDWYYGYFITLVGIGLLIGLEYAGNGKIWNNVSTQLNTATIDVMSNHSAVSIYYISDNCFHCSLQKWGTSLESGVWHNSLSMDAKYGVEFSVFDAAEEERKKRNINTTSSAILLKSNYNKNHSAMPLLYSFRMHFGNQGHFRLILYVGEDLKMQGKQHTDLITVTEPTKTYIAILMALAAFVTLAIIHVAIVFWRRSGYHTVLAFDDEEGLASVQHTRQYAAAIATMSPPPASSSSTTSSAIVGNSAGTKTIGSARITGLDTMRGLSLAVMIFVNYGGGGYYWFNHSEWDGLSVADLVFPWFIWIMGTSMVFSFGVFQSRGRSTSDIFIQVIKRSATLFILGLFLNNGFDFAFWRIPGVLQRFAVAYFVVASILLLVPNSAAEDKDATLFSRRDIGPGSFIPKMFQTVDPRPTSFLSFFRDITPYMYEWLIILLLLAAYLIIMYVGQAPGCPRGYAGPGGLHENSEHVDCTGGIAGYIDRIVFGNHAYDGATCESFYQCPPRYFDPEGLLGCLTTIVTCYLGAQAGRILMTFSNPKSQLIRLAIWGVVLSSIGIGLCGGEKFGGIIPLNKNLWSLSFVMVMSGSGFCLLSVIYYLVDVTMIWNGAPFKYIGMNAITIYFCHEVLQGFLPFSYKTANTHAAQLTCNLIGVSCWACVAHQMSKNKFFLSV